MIITDMHIHSNFSSDSEESPEEIIRTAISKGFPCIYFTDHHDMDFPVHPSEPDMDFQLDFETYFTRLNELKQKYEKQITVYIGVEQGICPETAPKLGELNARYPFDFVIASSHLTCLENGDPYYPSYYEGKDPVEAYREYFQSEVQNVLLTDSFHVYGHLDYAVRYCPDKSFVYHFEDYRDIFEELLRRLVEKGKGIEINTSGLTKIGFPHPHMEALKLYRSLGGEIITVGSDAHQKDRIGAGFAEAEALLLETGFRYYTIFKKGQPEFIRLS